MEWVYPIIVGVLLTLLGYIWKQMTDKVDAIRAECRERDDALWDQIGRDSYSGMRMMVHSTAGHTEAICDLDRRVTKLEDVQR